MYACPSCGAAVTDSGRRLIGPLCWLCGAALARVEVAPPLDYAPASVWIASTVEALNRANRRAESEV